MKKEQAVLDIQNLIFYYPNSRYPALDGVSFTVEEGEFIGICGPAGAGKTTLSLCLNGIIPHAQAGRMAGGVSLKGISLKDYTLPALGGTIGSVFQDPETQMVALTVEEEIAFGLENAGASPALIRERIEEAMDAVGIRQLQERSLSSLSGGQKQRVALASILAMRPRILILDEPTSELDPLGSREFFDLLARFHKTQGITIILFEQKVDQLAPYLDRLLVMREGKMVAEGKPERVLADQGVFGWGIRIPQVAEFAHLLAREAHLRLSEVPLTVEEGLSLIRKWEGQRV